MQHYYVQRLQLVQSVAWPTDLRQWEAESIKCVQNVRHQVVTNNQLALRNIQVYVPCWFQTPMVLYMCWSGIWRQCILTDCEMSLVTFAKPTALSSSSCKNTDEKVSLKDFWLKASPALIPSSKHRKDNAFCDFWMNTELVDVQIPELSSFPLWPWDPQHLQPWWQQCSEGAYCLSVAPSELATGTCWFRH